MQGIYQWTVTRPDGSELVYVGQATVIERRRLEHLETWANTRRKGSSPRLTRAVRKYRNAKFSVLEIVPDREQLTERERYWFRRRVAELGRENVLNIIEPGENPLKNPEVKAKNEVSLRAAVQASNRRRWQDPEYRAAHPNNTARAVEARVKEYTGFVSPDGVVYRQVRNLRAFCREHNLDPSTLSAVVRGKLNHHKGWTAYKEELCGVADDE